MPAKRLGFFLVSFALLIWEVYQIDSYGAKIHADYESQLNFYACTKTRLQLYRLGDPPCSFWENFLAHRYLKHSFEYQFDISLMLAELALFSRQCPTTGCPIPLNTHDINNASKCVLLALKMELRHALDVCATPLSKLQSRVLRYPSIAFHDPSTFNISRWKDTIPAWMCCQDGPNKIDTINKSS